MEIAENCVVTIDYTMTDSMGNFIESTKETGPITYIHGHKQILPGLENSLTGQTAGATVDALVEPDEGFGHRDERLVQQVPKESFANVPDLAVGTRLVAETEDGSIPVLVTNMTDTEVTVDANPPLAGLTVRFTVQINSVRKASLEEIAHGHVHGEGGVHH